MPSKQPNSEIAPTFELKETKAAAQTEQNEFWQKLRRFYRTGKKDNQSSNSSFHSVFKVLLNKDDKGIPSAMVKGQKVTFGPHMLSQLINIQLFHYQKDIIHQFKNELSELIDGLNHILSIKDVEEEGEKLYDFAAEIVAFDKLSELLSGRQVDESNGARNERLQAVLSNITEGLDQYSNLGSRVITTDNNAKEYDGMKDVSLVAVKPKHAFTETERSIKGQMDSFVRLMRSVRIAKLEVKGEYQEEVHDEFFEDFTWYRLSDAERGLFHPIVLVIDHDQLAGRWEDLSNLLNANWPVKIFVKNRHNVSDPNESITWEEASHRFRLELSAYCISHRNVLVYQTTYAEPTWVNEGLEKCLKSSGPVVMHLFIPEGAKQDDLMISKAAGIGRFFPFISYDPTQTTKANLGQDAQPTALWPQYELTISGQKDPVKISFTYADYKAFFDFKVDELMIVPAEYESDYLIPLAEYIALESEQLYGKIPFIWLTDDDHELHRAAVPNVWVVSCQERLDFWQFLQGLVVVNQAGSLEVDTADNLAEVREAHLVELERVREEATSIAAERLIQELLGPD